MSCSLRVAVVEKRETTAERIERVIDAMRCPKLPAAQALPWYRRRVELRQLSLAQRLTIAMTADIGGYQSLTMLFRWTTATLNRENGECVMEDSPRELARHLPIVLRARGRVLVTGLGLGCVVRGLLANPDVEHVDVIELDRGIVEMTGPEFFNNSRCTIYLGNAEHIRLSARDRWDFAWHDLWAEQEHLDVLHARVLARYAPRVRVQQGCWMMDRYLKARWPMLLLGASRRRWREMRHG